MDQGSKKIQCCEILKAHVVIYGELAQGATDEELALMNEAADEAIARLKAAHDRVIAMRGTARAARRCRPAEA